MLVTAGYMALASLYNVFLSLSVVRQRRRLGVSLGDGTYQQILDLLQKYDSDKQILESKGKVSPFNSKFNALQQAVRTHANFAEQAPFIFILIGFAEYNGLSKQYVHGLSGLFVLGRVLHYMAMHTKYSLGLGRAIGTISTMTVYLIGSLLNLYLLFSQ